MTEGCHWEWQEKRLERYMQACGQKTRLWILQMVFIQYSAEVYQDNLGATLELTDSQLPSFFQPACFNVFYELLYEIMFKEGFYGWVLAHYCHRKLWEATVGFPAWSSILQSWSQRSYIQTVTAPIRIVHKIIVAILQQLICIFSWNLTKV